ncbi:MAG: hypothetical protein R3F59_22505 [Myxococcota bacterium]
MTAPLTDPLSLAIAGLAAGVAVAVGWLQWPRPPALDGEAWFKIALCTLIRGRLDAAGASPTQWEREVVRVVPYHPAGRLPERKLSNPVASVLPGAALPGELALIEALAQRGEPTARAAWMYDEDPVGLDARFRDPAELGAAYRFERLGPGASWDALADWGAGATAFLEAARRAVPARWVLVAGRPDRLVGPSLLPALAAELPDAVLVPWSDDPAALGAALREAAGEARLVLVGEEAGVARLLGALADAADLRDQVVAVLSIGGVIGGRTDEEGPRRGGPARLARRALQPARPRHRGRADDAVLRRAVAGAWGLAAGGRGPAAAGEPVPRSRHRGHARRDDRGRRPRPAAGRPAAAARSRRSRARGGGPRLGAQPAVAPARYRAAGGSRWTCVRCTRSTAPSCWSAPRAGTAWPAPAPA